MYLVRQDKAYNHPIGSGQIRCFWAVMVLSFFMKWCINNKSIQKMHELQKKEISAPGEDKNLSLYYGADKIQKVIRVIHRGMINQQVSGS